ncbi:cyanophycinase [Chryseobacterium contaminans]|uniref:Cyanophycinase n=1 Tax=Chryseobacterium contaminans TaxID=1423959 RepID=A0A1M6YAV1_9FLAO|nr:cyanophycinase [Chryseobacterium contaminans]OCA78731.1 cyanophycinase [Chryseobacterium contaminans]SHL15400.1 cyanophycinase [Chryseobacterium contaminans]
MIPQGKLLLIGGKENKEDENKEMERENKNFCPNEILKLLTDSKEDRIEVITTASSDPDSIQSMYTDAFNKIGYSNYDFLDICDEQIHTDYQTKRISAAKTIFFAGGDQNRICDVLKQSALQYLIKEKYNNEKGFTLAGTSAGAMCIPDVVILEAVNGEAMLQNDIKLDAGWGFINNCIVDTHFIHRARFGRLAHAVILNQNCWGIGLGEDTALLIEEGNIGTCKGSGMAWLINAKNIGQTNIKTVKKGCPVFAENLKVHILTDNCKINLRKGVFIGQSDNNTIAEES